MKYELFDFQEKAVNEILKKISAMQHDNEEYKFLSSLSLVAPTGAGKTIISSAVIEGLFYGNDEFDGDSKATVLWLTDSPSLNEQTLKRFSASSDMINPTTSMVIIENDFTLNHKKLMPGVIYFLNRQLLSKKGNLVSGFEGSHTFYDIISDTIDDDGINLYLFIDEAHRGVGIGSKLSKKDKTIYSKLIDGQKNINPPMPVVMGISATPQRFNEAMMGRKNRDMKAPVKVSVKSVRNSGLIKDTIELRSPKEHMKVSNSDLIQACRRFISMNELWKNYCVKNNIETVIPLLVVQVENNISDKKIEDLCHRISNIIPGLDRNNAFANVFGEKKNIINDFAKINYISPDEVSNDTNVRILFAKDAISTGWDCPRAEVIYSQRTRKDSTYIAQLIGRMIRTPLARRIDSVDELNTVVCYLPKYDEKSVQEVVDELEKGSGTSAKNIISNPADVLLFGGQQDDDIIDNLINSKDGTNSEKFNLSVGNTYENEKSNNDDSKFNYDSKNGDVEKSGNSESKLNNSLSDVSNKSYGKKINNRPSKKINKPSFYKVTDNDRLNIKKIFESITTRIVTHEKPNYFKDFFTALDIIMINLDPSVNLDSDFNENFYRKVESEIILNKEEFEKSLSESMSFAITVRKIDPLTGKTLENVEELASNDFEASFSAYTDALKKFSEGRDTAKKYIDEFNRLHPNDKDGGVWRFTAVANTDIIMSRLQKWFSKLTNSLIDDYDSQSYALDDDDKDKWDAIVGNTKPYIERKLNISAASSNQDMSNKSYPKHIICDRNGKAYIKLNKLENLVVNKEISRPLNVAWYRNNPSTPKASLSIPYQLNGEWKNMYPDFIFFSKKRNGDIVPIIVDPHGDWLGDSIAKLQGYVEYLKSYPNVFGAVQAIADQNDGSCRYLNLLDKNTQEAIINFSGNSAIELFNSDLSKPYNFKLE